MFDRSAIAAALAALCGCNQLFGLEETKLRDAGEGGNGELLIDLDLDGISDERDACLAPIRDALDDLDQDGTPASGDPCPFDAGGTNTGDDDAIPNVCDPFPSAGGDRLRCYMSFGSTDLNARLWMPRDTTNHWSSREGELYSSFDPPASGIVSTRSLEGPMQMTYEASVSLDNANAGPGIIYAFRMWSRALDAFDNQDLGCEISGDVNSTRLAVVRGNDADIASSSHFVSFPRSMPVRIRLTVAPGATGLDIRCTFQWPMFAVRAVKATVADMPMGRFAFGTENLGAHISALAIYERDDVQPLP